MNLDPQTQGDARIRKHADRYLPTDLTDKDERKMGWNAVTAGVTLLSAVQTEPLGKTLTHCEPKYAGWHWRALSF